MRRKWQIAAMLAGVLLLVGLAFGGLAFAQGPMGGWGYGGMMGNWGYGGMMGGWGYGGMMGGSNYGWMMSPEHQAWMGNGGMHDIVWNAIARALGLTRQQLDQAFAQGQTLDEIARAQGKSRTDLVQAFKGAMREAVQQAVQDGELSQAQADNMLGQMDQHAEQCLFDHMGNGWQGMMGGGMMGGSGPAGGCHGPGTPSQRLDETGI